MIYQPLAQILRPKSLDDFYGQPHLLNNNHPLKYAIDSGKLHSMILWGPSGVGKTTLIKIIATKVGGYFEKFSAVLAGVKDIRLVVEKAKKLQHINKSIVLFVDEIHRFNKVQQDAFLPYVESGLITLIGATTENPSFAINQALLSRLSIYIFNKLSTAELAQILKKALKYTGLSLVDKKTSMLIIKASLGDGRRLINIVEQISLVTPLKLNFTDISKLLIDKVSVFDHGGDIYHQQLSAFHKSVRGFSADGALYWMARMLVAGCDIQIIARRLLAIASEDIGNADPRALQITLNAWDIFKRVGAKEGNRAIAQAAVYCAVAPKSNAVYKAFNQAMISAKQTSHLAVPKHLCNATTKLMESLGYGRDYRYAFNEKDAFAKGQTYFPKELGEQEYYFPTNRGLEIKISEKLKQLKR